MAETFKNANLDVTNSAQSIYTCPADTTAIVITLRITNVDGAADDTITAEVNDRIDADEVTNAAHRSNTSNPHSVTFAQLGLLDEDDMASNSATDGATQQSIKAYVDTQVATKASVGIVIALS